MIEQDELCEGASPGECLVGGNHQEYFFTLDGCVVLAEAAQTHHGFSENLMN